MKLWPILTSRYIYSTHYMTFCFWCVWSVQRVSFSPSVSYSNSIFLEIPFFFYCRLLFWKNKIKNNLIETIAQFEVPTASIADRFPTLLSVLGQFGGYTLISFVLQINFVLIHKLIRFIELWLCARLRIWV